MKKAIVIIIAILVIVPALLPATYNVERSVFIDSTRQDVYSYLVNLESWKEWSPWLGRAPESNYSFSGIAGVVGSSTLWESKDQVIKQTLVKLDEPEYLETAMEINNPEAPNGTGYFKLEEEGDRVKVTWGETGPLAYPVQRILGVFVERKLGPIYEKGLKNIKAHLEQRDDSPEFE